MSLICFRVSNRLRDMFGHIGFVLLLGCSAEEREALTLYGSDAGVTFHYGDKVWRVVDRPTQSRLLVANSVVGAAAEAYAGGTGWADPSDVPNVATAWFVSTGRLCTIERIAPALTSWDVSYSCA